MIHRQRISSGAKWESIVGYSRAIKVENRIYVTGTTALGEDGEIVGVGDAYEQAKQCLRNIEKALKRLDAGLEHVVRTRVYLTNADDFDGFARAHAEVFGEVGPANTTVIAGLFDPRWKVEIEVEAVLP